MSLPLRNLGKRKRRCLLAERLEPRLVFATDLVVTEVHFNPAEDPTQTYPDNNDFEFIEIQNVGDAPRPLAGINFSAGITFNFPAQTLAPGEHALVVRNLAAFRHRYGQTVPVAGQYTGALSNSGETLTLRDGATVLQSFAYDVNWSPAANNGHSLVVRDSEQPQSNWNSSAGWRASSHVDGSPCTPDGNIYPGAIIINEVLAHQDALPGDWIELHNTSPNEIAIGGWFLSDDPAAPNKYQIPANTRLAPGQFVAFNQVQHFGTVPNGANGFAFSELGEFAVLTAPPGPEGEVYGDVLTFPATPNGVSIGRFLKSTGVPQFALMSPTRGAANAPPTVGPVVFSEVMYNPATFEEFVELRNLTPLPVRLYDLARPTNTWRFTSGLEYTFPQNVSIPGSGFLLLVEADPNVFRAANNVPASVPILSYDTLANLSNSGERLELSRPGDPEPPNSEFPGYVPYYAVDLLEYSDSAPWPTVADGDGPSLVRRNLTMYGNDIGNWQAGAQNGTPGRIDSELIGPQVTAARVGGSSWALPEVPLAVGATQEQPIPWRGIDRLTLTFSEPVRTTSAALALTGERIANYAVGPNVPDNVLATEITWTISPPITADRLRIDLDSARLFDAPGNSLDGEWIDGASAFPSGNDSPGGDFEFSFSVLTGDVNADGSTNLTDIARAREYMFSALGTSPGPADVDRSGAVNLIDIIRIRNATRLSLPAPSAPASLIKSAERPAAVSSLTATRRRTSVTVDATVAEIAVGQVKRSRIRHH